VLLGLRSFSSLPSLVERGVLKSMCRHICSTISGWKGTPEEPVRKEAKEFDMESRTLSKRIGGGTRREKQNKSVIGDVEVV